MPEQKETKRHQSLWHRILKYICVTIASVFAIFILACTIIVWCLTPGRLTPMVADIASDALDADVSLNRVELSFWNTFPCLTVDVDELVVVSHALRKLPDSIRTTLPADADSLLSLKSFHAGLNPFSLLSGTLSLYDVTFTRPAINVVQVNDSIANYMVFPQSSEVDTPTDSTALVIPSISINRFTINDAGPLRFRALADSIDVALTFRNIELNGSGAPQYQLGIDGNFDTPLLTGVNLNGMAIAANGKIFWEQSAPLAISLSDFMIGLHDYQLFFDTSIDFSADLTVKTLKAKTSDIAIAELLTHLPQEFKPLAKPLKSNMNVRASFELASPWNLSDSILPSFKASAEIPSCEVRYETLNFHDFVAKLSADVNGSDLNASTFTINKLLIDGEVIDVNLSASVTNAMSDPAVSGSFKGAIDFNRFPKQLRQLIPATLEGKLTGKSDFRFKMSDLSANGFHRMKINGNLALSGFVADADTLGRVFTNKVDLEFGSNNTFIKDGHKVDSLLTISLKADTISASVDGLSLQCRNLRAGAGTANRSNSADTTAINPFGMKVAFDRMKLDSPADTLHFRLRNASASASLTRYNGNARVPKLSLNIGLDALHFGQALTKVALRNADVSLTINMNPRRKRGRTARADSLQANAGKRRKAAEALPKTQSSPALLSSDERRLFRRWNFSGHVIARGGRLVTPYFPLRNRIRNIDFKFNQDSLQLTDLMYKAGDSDFRINGTISNLRNALVSRRNNTLSLRLSVVSDTINVNQIVKALFSGGVMTEQADSSFVWNNNDDDEAAEAHLAESADTTARGPLLIPRNLDAFFSVRAHNILYSDLLLNSFRGDLLLSDGVLNLRKLSASTDVGSISIDGLYSGVTADSLSFGLGMQVKNFIIDRLPAVIPAVDTMLPAMKNFAGVVNADVAVTTDITPQMDFDIPSLRAAIKIEGDSLVLIDPDTFKTLSKWLMFRNKEKNMIDHMDVEILIENSAVEVFPFMFDIDRYRLGVMGYNDLAMNLNYHISVLKSPIPFKFGINVTGNPDNMKIRLGGAKVKDNMVVERQSIASDTRINIVEQINNIFRTGVAKARAGRISFSGATGSAASTPVLAPDSLGRRRPGTVKIGTASALPESAQEQMTVADSLRLIRQGVIPNPDPERFPVKAEKAEP